MIEEYSDVIEFLFSKNIEIESIYSFISCGNWYNYHIWKS